MWRLTVFALLIGGTIAIPPAVNFKSRKPPLKTEEEYLTIARNITHDPRATAATLKYKYVLEGGRIVNTKPANTPSIEVAATLAVNENGHYKAALIISREIQHLQHGIFENLYHHRARVGVFAHSEVLSVFPEFLHLADRPECHNKCSGACSSTCTFDGRKWDKTAGAGGIRAVSDISNVLCDHDDPYRHTYSVLVHEFGHTINNYGMTSSLKHKEHRKKIWRRCQVRKKVPTVLCNSCDKNKVISAYNHAKQNQLWDASSYGMVNSKEYWAQATGTFFHAVKRSTGHMNICGSRACTSEHAAREHLRAHDPQLFDILSYVYTNHHPELESHIGVCIA